MTYRTGAWVMAAVLLAGAAAWAVSEGDAVLGAWLTDQGRAKVEIRKEGDVYSGRIVWLKEPSYPAGDAEEGKTKHDRNNPDPALQARPLVGLDMLAGFTYAGDNTWKGGTIYDPENGKTYKCKLTLTAEGTLEVRGFIGVSLLGRTTVWTRAPEAKPAG